MNQFNGTTDRRLAQLEAAIAIADKERKEAQKRYDDLFADVFKIFDKEIGPKKPARFLAEDEMVIERRVTDPEERLNPSKLRKALDPKLWNRITNPGERVLDQQKLLRAIKSGLIEPEAVQGALEKPEGVVSKWFRPASKDDKLWLELQAGAEVKRLGAATA